MKFDVVVIGGGAAGLFCAAQAGGRGRSVAVLDHAERVGKKILISGGGRCNFTNVHSRPDDFLSANPHFAKSALARYSPADFIALVERYRIPYHEKTLGQLFCDGSAREIVGMLLAECTASGVEIVTGCRVSAVETGFALHTDLGEFQAESLVIATGGLSIPKMGATSFGLDVARQFGLNIVEPRAALVPFTFSERDRANFADLAGLSAAVVARAGGASFQEKMLVTHRGVSGPAILQVSSYWDGGVVTCDPVEGEHVPKRLADRWKALGVERWEFTPSGTEGYEKAEVMAGGVDTAELSSKTMECRRVPGLYFIGEVVDVTGHLGGHNFQWAWSSGWVAGQVV